MSFFGGDFFKKPFFKNEFFGEPFFLNDFFDDTTIAHGYSGGTVDASTIKLVCTRTITGTYTADQATITIDGTPATITGDLISGTEIDFTISEVITAGQVLKITMTASDDNNLGELTNAPISNNVV